MKLTYEDTILPVGFREKPKYTKAICVSNDMSLSQCFKTIEDYCKENNLIFKMHVINKTNKLPFRLQIYCNDNDTSKAKIYISDFNILEPYYQSELLKYYSQTIRIYTIDISDVYGF